MNISGIDVRGENVRLLASLLGVEGAELAAKLERGMANGNSIVALSLEDRHQIVAALTPDAPSGLTELRNVLATQLKQHRDREEKQRRARLHQDRGQRPRDVA